MQCYFMAVDAHIKEITSIILLTKVRTVIENGVKTAISVECYHLECV